MARITVSLAVSLGVVAVAAPGASADTLPMRDSAFTPSQVAADQYLTPPVVAGTDSRGGAAGTAGRRGDREQGVAGDTTETGDTAPDDAGVAGDRSEEPGAAVAPALVEQGATAPRRPSGSLPFTGGNLLALVWIALTLLAAGCAAEAVRRWLEAGRERARA